MTIDITGSDYDKGVLFVFSESFIQLIFVVTDYLLAHCEDVSINDKGDVEHAWR